MFEKTMKIVVTGSKMISTKSNKLSSENLILSRKSDYYKNLGAQTVDMKPAGWKEALPYENIPGPKPIPILGNMWRFMPYVGEFYNVPFHKFHGLFLERYGKIILLKGIPAKKPIIFIFDPNDMENLLRNAGPFPERYGLESFIYYRTQLRKDIFGGVGGVLTVQGDEWFKFRSKVNPILMQPRTAQQFVHAMDKVAQKLVHNMEYFSMQNKRNEMPENFLNELYKWSLESMAVIALDKHLDCLNLNLEKGSETQKLITSITEMFVLMYKLDVLPPFWKLFSTPSWRKYVNILDNLTATTLKYIEEALNKTVDEDKPEELSVIQRLAKEDKKVAVAMVMDMLIAGVDTTGRTLGAALYFLAKNQEKQERLREEILRNIPTKDSPVTKNTLANSPYLKAVIKETTRIAPVSVGILRTTVKDMVLSGYRIPKGSEVLALGIYTSNSEEFKDHKEFIPERWLRTTTGECSYKNAHPFAFLPFGFGARSCIGKRLANLELEVALIKIIRNFQLSWPHEDMVFAAKFLYGVESPLKIGVQPVSN